VVCGAVMLVLCTAAASEACPLFDCLFGWCKCGPARTTYTPPYTPVPAAAPACAPCVPQTVQYVPQTCYRTVYRPVPVTCCQPITGCDPCSGCPVTTYRPVTSWSYQACLMPYTTYRAVYSNPCVSSCAPCAPACAPTGCGPCGGTIGYGAPASGCVSCTNGATVPTYTAPPRSTVVPGTSGGTPPALPPAGTGGTTGSGGTGGTIVPPPGSSGGSAPLNPIPGGSSPSTFQGERSNLRPVVPAGPALEGGPRLNSAPPYFPPSGTAPPATEPGRTASRPVQRATHVQLLAAPPRPAPVYNVGAYDGGWQASHD
jgi:hypothetical protein